MAVVNQPDYDVCVDSVEHSVPPVRPTYSCRAGQGPAAPGVAAPCSLGRAKNSSVLQAKVQNSCVISVFHHRA